MMDFSRSSSSALLRSSAMGVLPQYFILLAVGHFAVGYPSVCFDPKGYECADLQQQRFVESDDGSGDYYELTQYHEVTNKVNESTSFPNTSEDPTTTATSLSSEKPAEGIKIENYNPKNILIYVSATGAVGAFFCILFCLCRRRCSKTRTHTRGEYTQAPHISLPLELEQGVSATPRRRIDMLDMPNYRRAGYIPLRQISLPLESQQGTSSSCLEEIELEVISNKSIKGNKDEDD